MICEKCGNQKAYRISFSASKVGCDHCMKQTSCFKFSDVYFRKPYFDPMLADADKSPFGRFVETREQKASIMRELGIREAA